MPTGLHMAPDYVGFDENRERVGTVLIKQNKEGKLLCKDNSFLAEKCLEEEFPVKTTRRVLKKYICICICLQIGTILQLSPKITNTLKNTLTYSTLREDLLCAFKKIYKMFLDTYFFLIVIFIIIVVSV